MSGTGRGSEPKRVLVVDADRPRGESLAEGLRGRGLSVMVVGREDEARNAFSWARPEVVFVQLGPTLDARKLASEWSDADAAVYLVAEGKVSDAMMLDAMGLGARDVLEGPLDPAAVARRLGAVEARAKDEAADAPKTVYQQALPAALRTGPAAPPSTKGPAADENIPASVVTADKASWSITVPPHTKGDLEPDEPKTAYDPSPHGARLIDETAAASASVDLDGGGEDAAGPPTLANPGAAAEIERRHRDAVMQLAAIPQDLGRPKGFQPKPGESIDEMVRRMQEEGSEGPGPPRSRTSDRLATETAPPDEVSGTDETVARDRDAAPRGRAPELLAEAMRLPDEGAEDPGRPRVNRKLLGAKAVSKVSRPPTTGEKPEDELVPTWEPGEEGPGETEEPRDVRPPMPDLDAEAADGRPRAGGRRVKGLSAEFRLEADELSDPDVSREGPDVGPDVGLDVEPGGGPEDDPLASPVPSRAMIRPRTSGAPPRTGPASRGDSAPLSRELDVDLPEEAEDAAGSQGPESRGAGAWGDVEESLDGPVADPGRSPGPRSSPTRDPSGRREPVGPRTRDVIAAALPGRKRSALLPKVLIGLLTLVLAAMAVFVGYRFSQKAPETPAAEGLVAAEEEAKRKAEEEAAKAKAEKKAKAPDPTTEEEVERAYGDGVIAQREERWEDAARHFRHAIRKDIDHADALAGLAAVLLVQQKDTDAKEVLARLVEVDPDNADAFLNLGLVSKRLGDADGARKALGRFVELAPSDPRAKDAKRVLRALDGEAGGG